MRPRGYWGLPAFASLSMAGSVRKDRGDDVPGFSLPGEAGNGSQGFSLGESELNFQTNIDNLFAGNLTLSLADEDGSTEVGLEEA